MKLIEARFLTLISVVLMLSVPVAAEFQVYRGSSVTLEDANTTITWGRNYTFNASMITEDGDTLSIGDRNISIGSKTSAQVNSTLWKYNLTGPYHNKTAIKLDASAVNGTNATVSFTGLPGFRFGRYELNQNNSLLREFRSGGEITWYETNWSAHNYTITYYNDTKGPDLSLSLETGSITEGGDIKIKCSSSDVSGISSSSLTVTDPDGSSHSLNCGQEFEETGLTGSYTVKYSATDKAGNSNSISKTFDVTSSSSGGSGSSGGGGSSGRGSYVRAGCDIAETRDSHSWSLVNRSNFSFENIDSELSVRQIDVNTQSRHSEFAVCSGTVEDLSTTDFEAPTNAYAVYQFKVNKTSETEIKSATIQFEVNQSFAQQYDRIVLSRYKDGWKDLDTTLVESTEEKWLYEAEANGFSYYAVRGENQAENENQSNSSQNQTARNQTGPVCGDDTCQTNESWGSCSTDCQKPEEVVNAENTIADAEQKISKDEPGYQTLQQAKNRFETGEYSEAEKLAQNALDQQQNKQRGSTLPWVLIAATLATLVLVIAIGYYGYQHWIENQIDQEVREIREKVLQEDGEVSNAGEVRTELGKAEKALDMDKHRQAKKSLDRIRGLLDR